MLDKNHTSKEWEQLWKDLDKTKEMATYQETQGKVAKTKNMKASNFGIGASMMGNYQDPLQGLTAEIRGGAGHIEFSPSISQGQGAHSFSKISGEKRQALKEMKKINKTTIATHAHPGVTGLSGFDQQRYSFNEDQRQGSVNEVRKAIDFAADVAEGGSITFHAGGFARPLAGLKDLNDQFEKSSSEQNNIVVGVIDKNTQSLAEGSYVRQNNKVIVPVFDYDNEEKLHIEGLPDDYTVPSFKPKESGEGVETKEFENFREYAAWLAKNDEKFKDDYLKPKGYDVNEYLKKVTDSKGNVLKDKYGNVREQVTDYYLLEQAAKKKFIDDQRVHLARQANQQVNQINRQISEVNKVNEAIQEALKETAGGGKRFLLKDTRRGAVRPLTEAQYKELVSSNPGLNEEDFAEVENGNLKKQDEVFDCFYAGDIRGKDISTRKKEFELYKESFASQVKDQYDKLKNDYETISDYALEQNKKSMADLGLELYEKNKMLERRAKKEKRPHEEMYFAVENLFPENYGAHPEELLKVIKDSREAMAEKLQTEKHLNKKKAQEIANKSIKATFDTGHLHMWKKHFKRDPKDSDEDWDKKFNEWALTQAKKLVDEGVIGNVHLADNFGFDDDHLTLGQGAVPIKKYLEMFDKAIGKGKITGKISVEGFDDSGERHGVHEAWKTSGAQMFRGQQATERWTNPSVGGAYSSNFGRFNQSTTGYYNKPSFVFGKYSPDPEEWGPWSDTTME